MGVHPVQETNHPRIGHGLKACSPRSFEESFTRRKTHGRGFETFPNMKLSACVKRMPRMASSSHACHPTCSRTMSCQVHAHSRETKEKISRAAYVSWRQPSRKHIRDKTGVPWKQESLRHELYPAVSDYSIVVMVLCLCLPPSSTLAASIMTLCLLRVVIGNRSLV